MLILYRRLNIRLIWGITVVTVFLYGTLYFILSDYTDSPVSAGDAFTTALSITATWMLARRILVLGGDRRGVGIVVLSAGFVSDLLFICMLWRISDCRMDQLEKERKVV